MSDRERDRELLVAYTHYLWDAHDFEVGPQHVEMFLASRHPPCRHNLAPGECAECDGGSSPEMESGNEPNLIRQCDTCKHNEGVRTFPSAPPRAMGCPSRGFCEEYEGWEPAAPPASEQRYWAVGPTFAPAGHWLCVIVYANGSHSQYGPPRPTREQAEADGAASGLEPWDGGGK